ncbi:MAG: hypothetical protein ABIZ80_24250, partial [Bryobacteraceae bacterium]
MRVDRPGRAEIYRFSCAVDFNKGRVRNAQIDPAPFTGDRSGGDRRGSVSNSAALQGCQEAVEDRIHRDGYRAVDFDSINVDSNPGRSDWVVG